MSESTERGDKGSHGQDNGHRQDRVTITIDSNLVSIHRGHQSVAAIMALGGVNSNDVLAIVVDGEPLRDLQPDGSITIKGGEVFVSHPRDGGSSSEERCRGTR